MAEADLGRVKFSVIPLMTSHHHLSMLYIPRHCMHNAFLSSDIEAGRKFGQAESKLATRRMAHSIQLGHGAALRDDILARSNFLGIVIRCLDDIGANNKTQINLDPSPRDY